MQLIDVLASMEELKHLDRADLELLDQSFELRRYAPGDTIITQHQSGDEALPAGRGGCQDRS